MLTFVIQSEHHTGAEITRRLGLRPTDVIDRDFKQRPQTVWGLDSDLPDDAEPSALLAAMLPVIEARLTALHDLRAEGAALFWSCMVTAKLTGNQFALAPDLLARLAIVGAPLDFDLYNSD